MLRIFCRVLPYPCRYRERDARDRPCSLAGVWAANEVRQRRSREAAAGIETKRAARQIVWLGDLRLRILHETAFSRHTWSADAKGAAYTPPCLTMMSPHKRASLAHTAMCIDGLTPEQLNSSTSPRSPTSCTSNPFPREAHRCSSLFAHPTGPRRVSHRRLAGLSQIGTNCTDRIVSHASHFIPLVASRSPRYGLECRLLRSNSAKVD